MSEIDWQRLADEHDRSPEQDTAEWLSALVTFDEDPEERERALDAEPLLLFRDLPEEETGPADIEAMKQAVASMRKANESMRRVDEMKTPRLSTDRIRKWSLAALVAMAVSIAGLTGVGLDQSDVPPNWNQATLANLPDPVPAEIAQMPLVEDIDSEVGSLMQIEDDGVSLVVVTGAPPLVAPVGNGDA